MSAIPAGFKRVTSFVEAERFKAVPGEVYTHGDFIRIVDGFAVRGPFDIDREPEGAVAHWDQKAGEVMIWRADCQDRAL